MNNTLDDPVVAEIRTVRRELAERFGNDVDALCDFLVQQEKQHENRLSIARQKLLSTPEALLLLASKGASIASSPADVAELALSEAEVSRAATLVPPPNC